MGCFIGVDNPLAYSLVAKKDLKAEIVRECEVGWERQRALGQEHQRIRKDQQKHQQQMTEILEKVSDQVKKVENICSQSVPVLKGDYYTPPVNQVRVNTPSTLIAPPNLPMCSGQEPVPSTEGLIDQWLFHIEGALATHTEEAVWSAVIGSVRGAAHELLEYIGYGEEMSVILRHIKE